MYGTALSKPCWLHRTGLQTLYFLLKFRSCIVSSMAPNTHPLQFEKHTVGCTTKHNTSRPTQSTKWGLYGGIRNSGIRSTSDSLLGMTESYNLTAIAERRNIANSAPKLCLCMLARIIVIRRELGSGYHRHWSIVIAWAHEFYAERCGSVTRTHKNKRCMLTLQLSR